MARPLEGYPITDFQLTTDRGASRPIALNGSVVGAGVAFADIVVITGGAWASGLGYHWRAFGHIDSGGSFAAIGLIFGTLFVLRLQACGAYSLSRLAARIVDVPMILTTWLLVTVICTGIAFLLKIGDEVSRGFFVTFVAGGPLALCLMRSASRTFVRQAVGAKIISDRRVLLIGERAEIVGSGLRRRLRTAGIEIAGEFVCPFGDDEEVERGARAVIACARSTRVDEILVCLNWSRADCVAGLVSRLQVLPLPVYVVADINVRGLLGSPATQIAGLPALEVQRAPLSGGELAAKRAFDFAFSALALAALTPLLAMIAIAIKLDSPGPVLFRQTRVGFSGRAFQIYKFRSMTAQDDGPIVRQATRGDRRITRVGRFLRSSSLDELPQLMNVLRGDMSLVGPRPHASAHDDQYQKIIGHYAYRHHVKPGITGLAQINNCRGETSTVELMERRVGFDIKYINTWSIWLDFKIIILTAICVIKNEAY